MHFTTHHPSFLGGAKTPYCRLWHDNWDDYGFKTTYQLHYVSETGEQMKIGETKILKKGLDEGSPVLLEHFDFLDETFCSLGQSQEYYENLSLLPDTIRISIVAGLRDCVSNPHIWEQFSHEEGMRKSLMRWVKPRMIEKTFKHVLNGHAPLDRFNFVFTQSPSQPTSTGLRLEFNVIPLSTPPTNVHVLIGRNGVGKTRLLAGIATSLTTPKRPSAHGVHGTIQFSDEDEDYGTFTNVVTVAFSAFDQFYPVKDADVTGDIRYSYVGLKTLDDNSADEAISLKSPEELNLEFRESLSECLEGKRLLRWKEAISILNTDPVFSESEFHLLPELREPAIETALRLFRRLSSGHKLVLLTVTKLVQLVDERTLVLLGKV